MYKLNVHYYKAICTVKFAYKISVKYLKIFCEYLIYRETSKLF